MIPIVSIIIPVFNNSNGLSMCLDALRAQSQSEILHEIIVVDNGSDEDIESVVHNYPEVIYTRENFPTSYAARNLGIQISRGNVLAFTDSDCIPARNWMEKGVKVLLKNPGCGMVGGRIQFSFHDSSQPSAVELYFSLTFLQQEKLVMNERFAATANLFTFRHVIDRIGLFDPTLKSSGDLEFGRRIADAGLALLYSEEPVVFHPAARTLSEIHRRVVRIEGGQFDVRRKKPSLVRSLRYFLKRVAPSRRLWHQIRHPQSNLSLVSKIKIAIIATLVKSMWIGEYFKLLITHKSRQFR